jgi:DNA polymerase epsilon subunit 1
MIVIFDSLQTAHKCILNSFYGYVMRKGARWYSMEMAGIVCLTGAKIIQLARSRVEQIGRPLELDTDGIWCVLPASFPENYTFTLKSGKTYTISYPCVMLNHLVHDQFTNHQYMDLDPVTNEYRKSSTNSIFFEVDGPYRAMILPASTEEDRLLKKRYAVFNHDGTIAELKGFEVKRRGELKLIKNFQSSIFKVFLEGDTLKNCYGAVASAASCWIDILESKGSDIQDSELFDLLTENRSMSKALNEYGKQKSTSITAARRLGELLGDHMVKNKGLACKFVISEKPTDSPVSERAVPIAIFYSDPAIKQKYLSKWLKDSSMNFDDIRGILDWNYYLERFGSVIQKLITIPAAFQNIENPVPRIKHPAWLAKRLAAVDSGMKQLKISNLFETVSELPREVQDQASNDEKENNAPIGDVEDFGTVKALLPNGKRHLHTPLVMRKRRKKQTRPLHAVPPSENPFNPHTHYYSWLLAQKPLWSKKLKENAAIRRIGKSGKSSKLSRYLNSNLRNIHNSNWEVLQISETESHGIFRLWGLINGKIESIDIDVPRILYLNSRVAAPNDEFLSEGIEITKVSKTLPRGHPCFHLYELRMTEYQYRLDTKSFAGVFSHENIEGVYESQVPLQFRALMGLGIFVKPDVSQYIFDRSHPIELEKLRTVQVPGQGYLNSNLDYIYFYHAKAGNRHFACLFVVNTGEMYIETADVSKSTETMKSVKNMYSNSYREFVQSDRQDMIFSYPENVEVSVQSWNDEKKMLNSINQKLLKLKDESGSLSIILAQTVNSAKYYRVGGISAFREFPYMMIPSHKMDNEFPALGWLQYALNRLFGHLFNVSEFVTERVHLARYSNVPVCNIENDSTLFLSDLFLARRLKSADCVLWCSPSTKPDLGGSEQDDHQSFTQEFRFPEVNSPGIYRNTCIEMDVWDLALNTMLKSAEFSNDLEASTLSGAKGNIHLLDEYFGISKKTILSRTMVADLESPQNAINQIRGMVRGWVGQVRNGNRFASHLLEHLHRWLTSRAALFYDGMVVGYFFNMMKRMYSALLHQLRQLGCTIIFSSFDKVVVETNKRVPSTALGYISYVLAAISKNSTFEHIDLKPSGVWDYLIWYDQFNYATFSHANLLEDGADLGDQNKDHAIEMKFKIVECLPPIVQKYILKALAEYLYVVENLWKNNRIDELSKYIAIDLKRKLFQNVHDIQRKKADDQSEIPFEQQYEFPVLPGTEISRKDPTLEFIKTITMILGLDNSLENETRLLKRDLLRLMDITEFSKIAIFTNPIEKFILPQVICEYCNYCCDLDLTKKSMVDESAGFLHCQGCMMMYNRDEIEQLLIEELNNYLIQWQHQDLRCSKCRQIRAELIPEYCIRCNGIVECVISKESITAKVKLLGKIAEYYRMHDLKEYSSFLLLQHS